MLNNPLSHTDETGEIIPGVVWGVVALTKMYNAYETAETLSDNYDILTDDAVSNIVKTMAAIDIATDALGFKKVKKVVKAVDKKLDGPNKMVPSKGLPGGSNSNPTSGNSSKNQSNSKAKDNGDSRADASGSDANTTKPTDGVKDDKTSSHQQVKNKGNDDVAKKADTMLYQKVDKDGKHLKFGIAKIPEKNRYTQKQLNGGRLRHLAEGEKKDMLKLERDLHETLPIGSEEGQKFYIKKQVKKGLKPPPYGKK